jgi:RHH-type rel operon transcriptional repressor/antitoxin RelB
MQTQDAAYMTSETFTVRVDTNIKKRLEKLAESTGRSRSFLTAEAIAEYLDANEWQIAGIKAAIASIKQEGTIAHEDMEAWVNSWGTESELPPPKPTQA